MKLSYNDQSHAYWLDGRRCKSVSAVAKIPDDTYSLDMWRRRQVLIGVASRPQLVEQAAAHFDDRDQLDRIAEEAMSAALSHDAANRGTAAHRITERVDLAELILDSPQAKAVAEAWRQALDMAGLEIVPELVERVVVYPDRLIAGRFDRICCRRDGRLVVVDLKTGVHAARYPHAAAVQMALYANAPLLAGPIRRAGGVTTTFEPLPDDLDRTVGYMVHMPADGQVDVLGVDLDAGRAGMEACFRVLDWRARQQIVFPVAEQSCEAISRDDWIRGRLKAIGELGDTAKRLTARMWPPVPIRGPWSDEQIDLLDAALGNVEAQLQVPFGDRDPAKQYATTQ